jgi:mono/diheme cytochrome c family protein
MSLIVSILALFILAVVFGWLAVRAWRARRALIRWLGALIACLLALVFAAAAAIASIGYYRLYAPAIAQPLDIQEAGTPEQIARGEKLAYLCVGCHSSSGELPLDGGEEFGIGPVGRLYPPNLTPGGEVAGWTDGEIIRAIRDGVHKDGRALLIMPSENYHQMSDADVLSLVAYLRSQPVIHRQVPETQISLLGMILIGTGTFPTSAQQPTTERVIAPPAGSNLEYGEYLVDLSSCRDCHGEDLSGGTSEFVPVGPPLPPILSRWSAEEFVRTMRTGVDPGGHRLNSDIMPWQDYSSAYSDEELQAIYTYILERTGSNLP